MTEHSKFVFIRRVSSVSGKGEEKDNEKKFEGDIETILKLQELVKSEIFSAIEKVKIFDTMGYLAAQVPSEELAAAIAARENQKK